MTEHQLIERIVKRVNNAEAEGRTNVIIFQDLKFSKGVDVTLDLIHHINESLEGTKYRASYDTFGDCIYLNSSETKRDDKGVESYETH